MLLVRRLFIPKPAVWFGEPLYTPLMLPGPEGEGGGIDEPPIDTGVEPESSIIIIACRRFAPAPMAIGVSGKGCDVGGCDSEIRLNGGT